jgi:ubiquinone/menaquinone biosynthesis C-methylase UbiE
VAEHLSARQLDDAQLESFDVEYVRDDRWRVVEEKLETRFGAGRFTFLDIGGGNGVFCDRILDRFPLAEGTVLDSSELLLSRNRSHTRKRLVDDTAEHLERRFSPHSFDVIFVNWLLHHLVGETYHQTLGNMATMLKSASSLLSSRGGISIFENVYDGFLIDNLPGALIYQATSSRLLAPIARRLGANTAGVGVCFLSERKWTSVIEQAGLRVASLTILPKRSVPLAVRVALHLKRLNVGQFWCEIA